MQQIADSRKRQLLVDISIFHQNDAGTGIQRVVRALSEQLSLLELADYEVRFVAARKWRRYHYVTSPFKSEEIDGLRIAVVPGDVFLGLDLCSRILPRRARQVRSWRKRGVTLSVVVYDLLPVSNPEWFNGKQIKPFRKWLTFLAKDADQILCISATVAGNFQEWVTANKLRRRGPPLDVAVIPLGAGIRQSASSAGINNEDVRRLRVLKHKKFILLVGTIEPRKGHEVAIAAFDYLFKSEHEKAPSLVIVGRPGWKTELIQQKIRNHSQFGRQLVWFDDASDELLEKLYVDCSGVIFPTLAEGFGLPVIEALSYHKPVLARDLPVLREFQRAGIDYFDNDNPEVFAKRILDWQANAKSDASNLQQETWQKSCRHILNKLKIPLQ